MTKEEMMLVVEEFLAKMQEFESSTTLDTTKEDISMWFWGRFYKEASTNDAFIEYCSN
jgi:hypothetical protein